MDKNQAALEILRACEHSSIYLAGLSFLVGSSFTILVLILLDLIRRNRQEN